MQRQARSDEMRQMVRTPAAKLADRIYVRDGRPLRKENVLAPRLGDHGGWCRRSSAFRKKALRVGPPWRPFTMPSWLPSWIVHRRLRPLVSSGKARWAIDRSVRRQAVRPGVEANTFAASVSAAEAGKGAVKRRVPGSLPDGSVRKRIRLERRLRTESAGIGS